MHRHSVLGICVISIAAQSLASCAALDWDNVVPMSGDNMAAPARPAAIRLHAPNSLHDVGCEQAAVWRANDAAAQGFEDTVQDKVHDAVLADCTVWRQKSGG